VGIIKRLFGGRDSTPDRSATATVDLVAKAPELRLARRDKPRSRDNKYGSGQVHVTGYHFVHADTSITADRDEYRLWRWDHNAFDFYASGVSHLDGDVLQSDGLLPSRRLQLVRDGDNEFDENAVALALDDGRRVGWVPRSTAAEVAARLDAGDQLECAVLDQTLDDNGERVAYSVLVAAPDVIDGVFSRARRWRN
jgi:hypothetical protein